LVFTCYLLPETIYCAKNNWGFGLNAFLRGETKKKEGTIGVKVLVLRKTSRFRMNLLSAVNLLLTTLLAANYAFSQPVNDACSNATALCPNVPVSATNQGATATVCPNCEDDFSFCFSGTHSVWFTFTTNTTGGDISIDFFNMNFIVQAGRGTELQASILEASIPCNSATYTAVGSCEVGASSNFSVTALALPPNTTYYVVVNGAENGTATLPAEASFDIVATGSGMPRLPPFSSIGGPTALCPKEPVSFFAYVDNCTDTTAFTWKVNGEITAVTTGNIWQTSGIEDGDVITMECSCFTNCPQALSAQLGPISVENLLVNAGADQTIASDESTTLFGATNGATWYWTPASTLANPTALQTIAIPESTTTYFLTATSPTGCTLSDDVVITVGGQFIVPGSFTPNGDGVNDSWIISGIDQYPNAHVTIYSRWGQEIMDLVGYSSQKSWDGTHNGKNVDDGTYFYIIELRDEEESEPIKGFVMVVR